jgi:phage recombination protein Bet
MEIQKTNQQIQSVVTDQELTMHLENLGLLSKLSNGEKNTYIQIAKAFGLNPFKREIHVSKYGDQMSVITGYEVYIKRAERTGQLDGWSATTTGSIEKNDLKGIVTIHRKDRSHPFIWEALYKECVQKTKDGYVTKFWQKAEFMIKKVAISQGFRLCFSDELGGMPYTEEEVPTQEAIYEVMPNTKEKQQESAQPPLTNDDKVYRTATGDVELIVELIDNAKDHTLLKTFQAINDKFFKTNEELNNRLKEKWRVLKAAATPTIITPTPATN